MKLTATHLVVLIATMLREAYKGIGMAGQGYAHLVFVVATATRGARVIGYLAVAVRLPQPVAGFGGGSWAS
jgi:hypothetical protein